MGRACFGGAISWQPSQMVSEVLLGAECSQCGSLLPADREARAHWRHAELASHVGLDELAAAMILCPECDQEDRERAYDEGAGD